MEHDAKVRRAIFIQNSTDIREMFEFAHPAQVLQAVNVYASHFYGSMLWNLYGPGAKQVFRFWNTCVKLAWGLFCGTCNLWWNSFRAAEGTGLVPWIFPEVDKK